MAKTNTKDYYELLGVPPRSHVRVIEESYWERAHSLQSIPTRKAQRRLGALNEAYETLGSPHKRAEYDRRRRDAQDAAAGSSAGLLHTLISLLGKPFRLD
jgi:curved DNA-binding protein CbpA